MNKGVLNHHGNRCNLLQGKHLESVRRLLGAVAVIPLDGRDPESIKTVLPPEVEGPAFRRPRKLNLASVDSDFNQIPSRPPIEKRIHVIQVSFDGPENPTF